MVPKLEGKPELLGLEATYALWGNNATKHDYNKYFNKYEATKQRVSSTPFPRVVDNQYQYSEKEGAVDNGWHDRNQYAVTYGYKSNAGARGYNSQNTNEGQYPGYRGKDFFAYHEILRERQHKQSGQVAGGYIGLGGVNVETVRHENNLKSYIYHNDDVNFIGVNKDVQHVDNFHIDNYSNEENRGDRSFQYDSQHLGEFPSVTYGGIRPVAQYSNF